MAARKDKSKPIVHALFGYQYGFFLSEFKVFLWKK